MISGCLLLQVYLREGQRLFDYKDSIDARFMAVGFDPLT